MGTKINVKDFNLQKVKLEPKGGLLAVYQLTEVVKGEPTITDYQVNVARDIHPDLQKLFKDLRSILGRCIGLTSFLTITDGKELGLTDAKKEIARKYAEGLLQKIDVRGLSWSGSDENAGIIITSVYETPNGLKTCINTPRIKIAQSSFGFEEELEEIADAIKEEVYEFLFNGKQAQLSLFGEENKEQKNESD